MLRSVDVGDPDDVDEDGALAASRWPLWCPLGPIELVVEAGERACGSGAR